MSGSSENDDSALDRPKRAFVYLRVSTQSQVKTDYDPEGISLPAQRLSCQRKADQMGNVMIVDEFVEPGKTARTMSNRPIYQDMLRRIREEGDIDMVLVYKLSRIHRNRHDDALVMMELKKRGVTLVSATENIDETPVGQLMHGILASYNEYRSLEDGADIAYKMGEKAKKGGTLGRAPIGYSNVVDRFEGRDVRTVIADPERADLVASAFELYSSGDFTLEQLSDELFDRGLRSRPGRYPATQVTDGQLAKLLRNSYYVGIVTYKGVEYDGRHEPLVDQALFDKVQDMVAARSSRGERRRVHKHPIKGLSWCGYCHDRNVERRMILQRAKGGSGGIYHYFFCRGRQEHACSEPFFNVDEVEIGMADLYSKLKLDDEFVQKFGAIVRETIGDDTKAVRSLRKQIEQQLARLDTQESNLIDLAADGMVASAKVKNRLLKIEREREQLRGRRESVAVEVHEGAALVEAVLDLLSKPLDFYLLSKPAKRKMINQALFEKIYIYRDASATTKLKFPAAEIVRAEREFVAARSGARSENERAPDVLTTPGAETVEGHPNQDCYVTGLSKTSMVGLGRFELPTSSSRTRRATKLRHNPFDLRNERLSRDFGGTAEHIVQNS